MTLLDRQRQVFVRVGIQLIQYQGVEHALRLCIQIVLPAAPIRTLSDLHTLEERERTKTIGYFLSRLRTRVTVAPDFDEALTVFLRGRNAFVHDLSQLEGWNPRSDEGCVTSNQVLDRLERETEHIQNVLSGLIRAWELQNGKPTVLPGAEAEFERIEREYLPLAQQIFGTKDA
jgi:hypothetical protein